MKKNKTLLCIVCIAPDLNLPKIMVSKYTRDVT